MTYQAFERWKTQPNTTQPDLSVVIPAYNEEIRILPTIGAVASYLSSAELSWELIVSDDGSSDDTVKLVEELEFANLRVIRAPQNEGKGSAVRRGMLAAEGRFVLFSDADFSTPIHEVEPLLAKVRDEEFDVAVGSRSADGAQVENRSRTRLALSSGLNLIVRSLLGIKIKDTQCGFKLFTKGATNDLFKRQTVDGFSFDLELLFLAKRLGLRVAEVPVTWYEAPFSKVDSLREPLRFLKSVVEIRWKALTGTYSRLPT